MIASTLPVTPGEQLTAIVGTTPSGYAGGYYGGGGATDLDGSGGSSSWISITAAGVGSATGANTGPGKLIIIPIS